MSRRPVRVTLTQYFYAAVFFLGCGGFGCSYQPAIERAQAERGYLLILPGVESYGSYHEGVVQGLREGGVDQAIEIDEWGYKPFGTFKNLANYEGNRKKAADAARRLVDYAAEHPGRPITVLGYSGGGGMALFLAEALPPGFQIDRFVLTAPAISPDYDIAPALAHARRGVVNFYSPEDWFMAGMATEIWGTMDRKKTATAGRLGFRDAAGELLQRDGLVQTSWIPAWRRLGNDGGHAGWRSRAWAREVLAPVIKRAERHVVMITGVSDLKSDLDPTMVGLHDAGLDAEIETLSWGRGPLMVLRNLRNLEANRKAAAGMAEDLARQMSARPTEPVTLLGFSAGGGIAVLTAEALPQDTRVERLILVGAALSPRYDLSAALAHTRHGIVSFYSSHDWLILGWGTKYFGTIDRYFGPSAGQVGFQDEQGRLIRNEHVRQIGWVEAWKKLGHRGGHVGWLSRDWAHNVLAPAIDPGIVPEASLPDTRTSVHAK